MRSTIVALVLLAVLLALAACFPATRPKSITSEPLVPTVPPRALPSLIAAQATATVVAPTPPASPTPSPLPTATASQVPRPSPVVTLAATASPVSAAAQAPTATATTTATQRALLASSATPASGTTASTWGLPASDRGRIGVGVPLQWTQGIGDFAWGDTPPGWYLNWLTQPQPTQRADIPFARMIRLREATYSPDLDEIRAAVTAHPGSLWLVGNEPDVPWQDNATPEQYAVTYGVLYGAIKAADPTAFVAIGGVSQPTPLRMAYLDRILAAYKARYGTAMPVDVWNVHAFILREERDSWGVGIPPGMPVDQGRLYEIEDHTDMAVFKRQIEDFRRWMAERGQRNKPLIVSEYGALMPEDYGFPPAVVARFMTDTFDYFLTARHPELGYAADGDRLVQAFCWYSAADEMYPTPNLFDPKTRAITPVGAAFKQYVARLK